MVLIALAFSPLLALFFVNLWARPQYQFFPVALLGAIALAWSRIRAADRPLHPGPAWMSGTAVAASWVMLAAATLLWSPWISSLAALTGAAGLIAWRGGWRLLTACAPAGLAFATCIPPPLRYDERLTLKLREIAVEWSSIVLDALHVPHILHGNIVEIPGQRLLVEEACSGINSLLSVSALTLLYCLWRRRHILHAVAALVLTIMAVLFGNTLRIVVGAYVMYHWKIDVLSGQIHEWIGLGLMAFYLVFALSVDQFLYFFSEPPDAGWGHRRRYGYYIRSSRPHVVPPPPAPTPAGGGRNWARIAVTAFLLLGAGQILQAFRSETLAAPVSSGLVDGASFSPPERIGAWRRVEDRSTVRLSRAETSGVFSHIWNYENGDTVVSVALDYPFRGYYDVATCYTFSGWRVAERIFTPPAETNGWAPHIRLSIETDSIRHGCVWFSTLDERGKWMDTASIATPFRERFPGLMPTSYRFQLLMTAHERIGPAQQQAAEQVFLGFRASLAPQVLDQVKRK